MSEALVKEDLPNTTYARPALRLLPRSPSSISSTRSTNNDITFAITIHISRRYNRHACIITSRDAINSARQKLLSLIEMKGSSF
ncbi:hypothetical protein midi_00877 [Candidatus Midichloria mitochondrii IricVA]|uniref:Uncharacterized protein n=1 Tax=Midichloria mitochondrii (strain IricVA) TaxID=696127 RepID=F7XWW4_MIDMI|nr:hypothetical protein midi_00877 [Candidatus Midichloria mitochondrii IricVA]